MKCPRCHHDVRQEDHFCPYCGYDLKKSAKITPFQYPLFPLLLIVFLVVVLPIASSIYSTVNILQDDLENAATFSIKPVEESKTRTKLYSFDSIASFKKNVSNADVFLEPIDNYTTTLNSQYQTQFDAQASFVIYSDYDVHINLVEKAHLSNNEFLTINRSYDRKQDDEITTSYTKSHLSHFDELTLKDEREKISTFVPVQTYDALVNKLLKQKDVFEDKKDKIGHYGIGAYNKDASLVIYQDGEYYKSTLRVMTNGNHSLKRQLILSFFLT